MNVLSVVLSIWFVEECAAAAAAVAVAVAHRTYKFT